MKSKLRQRLKSILAPLEAPEPELGHIAGRIAAMERNVVLPTKAVVIAILIGSFYFSPWMGIVLGAMEVAVELTQYFFLVYLLANAAAAVLLFNMRRLPLAVVQWAVFTTCLVDGMLLAGITVVTLDFGSILYWLLFLVLIIRNAVSLPAGTLQLVLNFATSLCYVLAGISESYVADNLDPQNQQALEQLGQSVLPTEVFVLRLVLLWLLALCCYGVQVLLERQRLVAEEAREFAVREGQLHSAGRLAAEFAHQIKNPLAIINNAAFSLQRGLRTGKTDAGKQVEIIQEEVARADRIVTQIMGYAQLAEGRVEKLNVTEELDRAIDQVFPPAVSGGILIHRHYAHGFPSLLLQRRHLSEALVNVLQNAREALGGQGNIYISAKCHGDYSVEVSVQDDGPGIPADQLGKVFEAYFTTKERGSGLGLAIAKHNVELYGGSVRVESELGKGATFTLLFPAKALVKLGK